MCVSAGALLDSGLVFYILRNCTHLTTYASLLNPCDSRDVDNEPLDSGDLGLRAACSLIVEHCLFFFF